MSNQVVPTRDRPIAVDVMGGDHGSYVVVEGSVRAARELGIAAILVGNQAEIDQHLKTLNASNHPLLQVQPATEVFTMNDVPSRAIRTKVDASMRVAYELVRAGKASAVVSPGNTGVMMAVGLMVCGAFPGIARPAIATLIPKSGQGTPTVLLDSGANVDCHAEQLIQFALMGDVYSRAAISCQRPRIGLLSNGTESSKGSDITRAAAQALSEMSDINYIGYVEGRDIIQDVVDVVVCDGFVGNIVLKAMEGTVELVMDSIKSCVDQSLRAKIGMLLAKPAFKKIFSEKLDPSAYGGAPLLGLNEVAIVCHGSAKDKAIFNALRVAHKLCEENLISHMRSALGIIEPAVQGGYENGMWNRLGHRFDKKKGDKLAVNEAPAESHGEKE